MYNFRRSVSLLTLVTLAFPLSEVTAQTSNVGIGTETPHSSAKLEITEVGTVKKGLLIPRVSQIELLNFENQHPVDGVADGLLVYEEELGQFWYYKWDTPTPANPPFGQWINLATGTQTINSNVPTGGIIMWSGTIASIPSGWTLCNGSNGSPDLTDRFLISVSSSAQNPQPAELINPSDFVEVDVQDGNDKRFYRIAYIMKL